MKRWRKVLSLILMLGLVVCESTQALATFAFDLPTQSYADFSAYQGIKVFVNGRYVEFNDDLGYPIGVCYGGCRCHWVHYDCIALS